MKTPSGGRRMAKITLKTSVKVTVMIRPRVEVLED
jgi:hypothetical protein